jgi:putative redox protein
MRMSCSWQSGMKFEATSGEFAVSMDAKAPLGTGTAMSPKQLVAAGLCGCTAMDVAAAMRKHRQPMQALAVNAEIESTKSGYPAVFTHLHLHFRVQGEIDADILRKAVHESQTKYCGVSAMLAQAAPISYSIELNGAEIGTGQAEFAKLL